MPQAYKRQTGTFNQKTLNSKGLPKILGGKKTDYSNKLNIKTNNWGTKLHLLMS